MGYSETLRLVISGDAKGAIRALNEVKTSARATDAAVAEGAAASGAANQTLGQKIKANSGAIMAWGTVAATAGVLAVGAAKKAADEFARVATQVRNVQRATGETAGGSSRLVAVLDDFGISGDKAAASFARFGKNLASGKTDLTQYGAEVFRNTDGTLNFSKTLESVADAYKSQHDPGIRSQMLLDAFGKSGRDLIPILEGGSRALRQMFADVPDRQILSNSDLSNAREYKLALDNLDDALREIAIVAGSVAAPAITKLANTVAETVRSIDDLGGPLNTVSGGLLGVGDAAKMAVSSFPGIGPALGAVGEAFGLFGGGASDAKSKGDEARASLMSMGFSAEAADRQVEALGLSTGNSAKKAKEHAQALIDETNAIKAARQEADTYINSQLGLSGALLNVESAQRTYATAVQENGAESLEARQAAQSLAESIVKVGMAQQAAGKSTQEQVSSLGYLAATLAPGSPLRTQIEAYIARLNGVPETKTTLFGAQIDAGAVNGAGSWLDWIARPRTATIHTNIQTVVGDFFRAAGGPVDARSPYIVGERGPEMFVPSVSGSIIPNHKMGGSSGRSGGGSVVMNFTVAPGADVIGFGKAAREAIAAYERRAGMN